MTSEELQDVLRCPLDGGELEPSSRELRCADGHRYPIVEGTPVMLHETMGATIELARASLGRARGGPGDPRAPELHLESVGVSEEQKELAATRARRGQLDIDPVVDVLVAATNGALYRGCVGRLARYPIPRLRWDVAPGRLLDLGCSWGRWSVAAARLGHSVVGLDPSLGAVLAARRVCGQLGVEARFVVGDARFLPFAPGSFDRVHSYSVLQHLSERDVRQVVLAVARVLRRGGASHIQMANGAGLRSLQHQLRRGFREARDFEVRYRSLAALQALFGEAIGPTTVSVDGFFGLGVQPTDLDLLGRRGKGLVAASELLRRLSARFPALVQVADSVYLTSFREG